MKKQPSKGESKHSVLAGHNEKVKLRSRINRTGTESLFLDYSVEGKRKREFLQIHIISNPRTPEDRRKNKENLEKAKAIRNKRNLDVERMTQDYVPEYKLKTDFLDYFRRYINKYTNKDKRVIEGALKKFEEYVGQDTILAREVTEPFLRDFKQYLENKLNGETPYNYFKKLKKVIKQATKDNIFQVNPIIDIENKKTEGIKKDILTFDEIKVLASTHCGNPEIKRAFLFCCITGLRLVDVKHLRTNHISNGVLKIRQQKTDHDVIINLNNSAMKILEENPVKQGELIFSLPSNNGCNKVLGTWVKKTKIEKHITWHCARHSFGTNLLLHDSDVMTVSSLLGHKNTRETEKYLRVAEKLKEKAVNRLPDIEI